MVQRETRFWPSLCVIAIAELFVLTILLTRKSFTIDETYELQHLSTNLFAIAKDSDGFPPLYRWLLSLQIGLTGETWARAFSAFLSAMTVVVIGMIGRRISDARTGLISALFFATSACQLEYAQQCRAYSFYIFAAAVLTYAFVCLGDRRSASTWSLFVVASWFAWMTHYYALFYIAVLWVSQFFLVCASDLSRQERKGAIVVWFASAFLFVVLSIPTLICLRLDFANPVPPEVVNRLDVTAFAYTFLTFAQGWCLGPSSIELQEMGSVQGAMQMAPWAFLSLGASSILLYFAWRNKDVRYRKFFVLAIVAVPLLVSAVSSVIFTSYVSRYLACLIVPVSLVVGIGARAKGQFIASLATLLLVVLNLLSFGQRNGSDRYDRENYRLLQREIADRDSAPRIVILSPYLSNAVRREFPSHWTVNEIGFYSDEPDYERMETPEYYETIIKQPGTWIITDWHVPGSQLAEKRDRLVRYAGAKYHGRVANTIQLYHVP